MESSGTPPRPDLALLEQRVQSLQQRPLMLLCVAVISGAALSAWTQPGLLAFAFAALGAGVVVATSAFLAPRMALAPLLVASFAIGGLAYEHRAAVPATDLSHLAGAEGLTVEGTVIRPPDDGGWRRRVRIEIDGAPGIGRLTGRVETGIPRQPELAVGDRVRLSGLAVELPEAPEEPGDFDYRAWLAREGVRSVATARGIAIIGEDRSLTTRLTRSGLALRQRVVESIEAEMPGVDGPFYSRLMVGMVYGLGSSRLPEEVAEQFRRTGTVHLLVVSGAQVSMLAMVLVGLTGGGLRRMRWWQAILAGFGVLVLVVIVGIEASVGRAVAMFALVALAALSRRDYDVYTAIAVAAAVIVLSEPFALLSLSFQLTFAATLGIVLFLPSEPLTRINGSRAASPLPEFRSILWATVGAWALTTPLLAHSFEGFALSGSVANLTNVPLRALVLLLGFAALPVALLSFLAPLLPLLCHAARAIIMLMMHITELAIGLPMVFVEDVQVGVGAVVAWYVAVALVVAAGFHERAHMALDEILLRQRPSWPTVTGLALLSALVCSMALAGRQPGGLELTLLPVGAGQCAVVRAPSGSSLMVDCGGGENLAAAGHEVADGIIVPWLTRRKIDHIDAIAITHWDADHCNALPRALSLIPTELLLVPPQLRDAEPPAELAGGIGAEPQRAAAGARLDLGESLTAEVLAPRMPLIRARDAANENSVVMMITSGSVRLLLTGDIGEAGARRLVRDAHNTGRSLRADVLVLPHHGRRLAEVEVLLDAVRPTWAIASCDESADDYLGPEEMALLESRGIRLLRTDRHGAITVFTDGRRVRLSTSRGSRSLGSRIAAARG
ncbi:MAG: ComEC/Rec2 family competence protein [Armatimonadota bacterium]